MHPIFVSIIVAVVLVLFYNGRLWGLAFDGWPGRSFQDYVFLLSFGVVLTIIFTIILQLFAFPKLFKPVLAFIFISASVTSYFMTSYGIIFDKMMITNIISTDAHEARNLISANFIFQICIYGLAPAAVISRLQLTSFSCKREIVARLILVSSCVVIIAIIAVSFYENYATFVRNNRIMRYAISPTSAMYYTFGYALDNLVVQERELQRVANEVTRGARLENSNRPTVLVLIIGETARATNFSLNGYARNTNPLMSEIDVVNFSNATSCGTSTAESLPCMFSPYVRGERSITEMANSENLLDVLTRAGFEVMWIENNSGGCKGGCRQEQRLFMGNPALSGVCAAGECMDSILNQRLAEELETVSHDTVFVLHQMGSHGPTYYEQYPEEFRRFTPTCDTNQLQNCTDQEIENAYDNTILYTDRNISTSVSMLEDASERIDPVLMYVSDHGESLGENGIYLHGFPFLIAPVEQTHVPLIMWFGKTFEARFGLQRNCIQEQRDKPISHDNMFHTVLGMLNVHSDIYRQELDFLNTCNASHAALNLTCQSLPSCLRGQIAFAAATAEDQAH